MSRITINSNIISLNAQRRYSEHTNNLQSSFTRLSSGLRINKASDDAAGLSVSSLLEIDRRISNQSLRNINDGVSYLNVAEGAISELTNILIRIGELAEQGSNGTLGQSQRNALQSEVTSLEAEYNRIINSTKFNGNSLLTGLTTSTTLQGGYGIEGQLSIQVGAKSLGLVSDPTRAGLRTRVDTDSSGIVANASSSPSSISADGRYVLFNTSASNLGASDTNSVTDVYMKDILTGKTTLISTSSDGTRGNGASSGGIISANGRFVTFSSSATNLVSGDTNGQLDAFIKDLLTNETRRVSTSINGTQGNGFSGPVSISADGRYVLLNSGASNLIDNDVGGLGDAFLKDTLTGEVKLIGSSSSGVQANAGTGPTSMSLDGRYVTFFSNANNLVSGDTNLATDAFVKDTVTGITTRISTDSLGNQSSAGGSSAVISADGRYVSFTSMASDLVSNDTNGSMDVFVKDLITGSTRRVNTDSSGNQVSDSSSGNNISADGRYVSFFSSSDTLVSGDTNGTNNDAFIKDLVTGETRMISRDNNGNQISNGVGNVLLSHDGRYATFYHPINGQTYHADLSKTGIQEVSGLLVTTRETSMISLDLTKKYLEELSGYQAGIGANLSRAESYINVLQIQSENYGAASSQITDVDVAEESSRLLKTQILQRAASSVLEQSNFQPQIAISLINDL